MLRNLAILFLAATAALAQSDRSTLTGLVTDQSGAVIPGAAAEAVNQATGLKYTTSSNQFGIYALPQLPVGRYKVTVQAPGFADSVTRIQVHTAETMTLNFAMKIAAAQLVDLDVDSPASVIDATTSENSTGITEKLVTDLPLSVSGNMRNPESFIFLTPGVTGTAANTQIDGSQSRAKEVLFDGVGATSPESGGTLFTYPSVEAVSEFRLVNSDFSAEYGRTGGGFEVFSSKSGTNTFHGAAFDYLRNNVFDARGFFATAAPVNRQNEFGAALGGPVAIPRVYNGRKRSFFYFVYSGFRYLQSSSNALVSIPPVAFRDGNFSSLVGGSGKPILIYNPASTTPTTAGGFTRTPFPGNQIPQSSFSSVSSKIVTLLPQPTNGGNLNNFLALAANSFSRDQVDVKIDHSFTDANRLSGFLYVGRYAQINPDTLPDPFTNALNNDYESRWARLSDDWSPSSRLLNHAAFGFTREAQLWNSLAANQNWPTQIGLTGVQTGAGNAFPYVTFNDGYSTWGSTNGTKTVGEQINNVFQFDDSVIRERGRHSLKFGADARWLQTNGADYFGSQGNFAFNTLETGLPGSSSTGSAFASFLLGDVHQGQLNQLTLVPGIRSRYLAGFAQDDWKISRTLTLNLGLRYEVYFPRTEAHDNLASFDPTLANPGAGNRPGAIEFLGSGPGRSGLTSFANTDYKNFGPRVGFAWAPMFASTVLHGGYGIYYGPGNADSGLRQSQSFGFGFNASPVFASTNNGVTPAFDWDSGFPQNYARPPDLSPTVVNSSAVTMIGANDGRPPYFQNWSVGVEHELPANLLLEADYVGVKGTRLGTALIRPNELNPSYLSLGSLLTAPVTSAAAQAAGIPVPYPGFTGSVAQALRPFPQYLDITNLSNPNGNSTYHALQMKMERRVSHGLTGVVAYAWSKTLTDADIAAGGGPAGQTFYNRGLEKALSDTDVPQAVSISFLYELPFGPGKRFFQHGGLGKLMAGWTLTNIDQYWAGTPIVPAANNTLPLFNSTLRPNVVSGVPLEMSYSHFDPAVDRYINPAAFTVPASFTFGSAARSYGSLRAPWTLNESAGAVKRMAITERVTLIFRAEFFNLFNRVAFGAPASNISAANFGVVSSQSNAPRQGQMALRLEF
ncbi:MAG: TonB-dependent receptor [Bryobacteraceae bacterium]|jgi:hypothetical protein